VKKFIPPVFIGIAGPSGAGKSSLCKELKKSSRKYEHVKLDNYFKHTRTFQKKHGYLNWEHPTNIKYDVLLRHLRALAKGKQVHTKSFPKVAGGTRKAIILKPKQYILVEGFLLFKNKLLREFLDKKIYLDVPPAMMLKRRAVRFGASHVADYDTKVAIPEYLKIGVVQKKFADYVVRADRAQRTVVEEVKRIIE